MLLTFGQFLSRSTGMCYPGRISDDNVKPTRRVDVILVRYAHLAKNLGESKVPVTEPMLLGQRTQCPLRAGS